MLLPQRLLSTWSSPGLKHTLKSLDHLPSLFQPSSSIRLRRGCSWSFITYQTLKWVQLVILLPLSPSLLCLPSKKPFSDQQHSGVDCDPGSVASPGARRWQNKSKPCSDPLPAPPIPSAWHTRGRGHVSQVKVQFLMSQYPGMDTSSRQNSKAAFKKLERFHRVNIWQQLPK